MARILIVTSGHLATNPRVWREADALAGAGHDVEVTGVWLDAATAEQDLALLAGRRWSFRPAADLRGTTLRSRLARAGARVRSRAGRTRVRWRLGDDPHALGYAVDRLERVALRAPVDLTILHLEPALWVGERLLAEGRRIAVDIEDWYSENRPELPRADQGRLQLARLEQRMFRAAHSTTTTSLAMATALATQYGMTPAGVVYNGVAEEPLQATPNADVLRLVWLSHAVGRGRGLEELFTALRRIGDRWRLTLIGHASVEMRQWVRAQLGDTLEALVQWHDWVPPAALGQLVAAHHVGLALEVPRCRNKDLTASNKICHYLQTGLMVAASDTAGQREVMGLLPAHGRLYAAADAGALADLLAPWVEQPELAAAGRAARHAAANAKLSFATQAPAAVASAARALGKEPQ